MRSVRVLGLRAEWNETACLRQPEGQRGSALAIAPPSSLSGSGMSNKLAGSSHPLAGCRCCSMSVWYCCLAESLTETMAELKKDQQWLTQFTKKS